MARLRVEIIGEPSHIAAKTFRDFIADTLGILDDLDAAISERHHSSLEWYVRDLGKNGRIHVEISSSVRPERRKRVIQDVGREVAHAFVAGLKSIEDDGVSPPHLSEYGMKKAQSLAGLIGGNGARGFVASIPDEQKTVKISEKSSDNLRKLIPPKRVAIGSVEGKLEAISLHGRKPRFIVYHGITGKGVACSFDEGDRSTLQTVKDTLGHRVNLAGTLHINAMGEPVQIDMESLRVLRTQTMIDKIAGNLGGVDPAFTGELTTERFIREIRGD